MSEQKGIVKAGNQGVQLTTMNEMYRFAEAVVKGGFAPKGMERPESVFIALQMGAEVGLAPMQSVQNIAVINGRPSMWGDAVKGLIEASDQCVYVREYYEGQDGTDNYTAICETQRRGRPEPVRATFSVADAKRAGLWGKSGPWTQYPRRMLQMRARAFCLRDAYPDVLRGLRVAEEEHDRVWVEAEVTDAEPAPVSRVDAMTAHLNAQTATEQPETANDATLDAETGELFDSMPDMPQATVDKAVLLAELDALAAAKGAAAFDDAVAKCKMAKVLKSVGVAGLDAGQLSELLAAMQ